MLQIVGGLPLEGGEREVGVAQQVHQLAPEVLPVDRAGDVEVTGEETETVLCVELLQVLQISS